MQQLSADLWKVIQMQYGDQSKMVGFQSACSLCAFPFRAVLQGVLVSRRGGHIHLGDLSLAPLALVIKFLVPSAHISATVCGLEVLYGNRVYQWILRHSLASMDTFACISTATADELRECGVRSAAIAVIPCGVWEKNIPSHDSSRPYSLLTVGRLIPRKGVAWFIRHVLPLLQKSFPNVMYTVVGSGPDEKAILQCVEEMNLENVVHLAGRVSESEKDALLASSQCFVMPNVKVEGDMEGFGIVCLEAGRAGVPVVAARLEGVQDAVLEGTTGLFFQSGNAEDCAEKITTVLSGSFTASSVTKETMQHFGWDMLAKRYYNEIFNA